MHRAARYLLFLALFLLASMLSGCTPAARQNARGDRTPAGDRAAVRVYHAAPADRQSVAAALDLGQRAGELALVDDPTQADVLVLEAEIPEPERMADLVAKGAGLLLILGPETDAQALGTLLGAPVTLTKSEDALSITPAPGATDSVVDDIVWGSAPQVRERFALQSAKLRPIITGYESGEPVLAEVTGPQAGDTSAGAGKILMLTAALNGANGAFQEWPYFNYLIYHLAMQGAGRSPLSFADYAGSPVPQPRDRAIMIGLCLSLMVVAFVAFFFVRRYSLRHPEALEELVVVSAEQDAAPPSAAWEEVGFHRALGGFLFAMMMGVLLFIPLVIYQNMILPTFILPSAQAFGLVGRVSQIFAVTWTLFDLGTSVAFVKFYSQYRVRDPRRAIQFGQVYVWWQTLSGAFQVALVILVAGAFAPRTSYAIYTWIIVAHALIQIPGFFRVLRDALYAQQRLDYAQIMDNFYMLVWPMVTQPVLVLLMLWWGKRTPEMGPALGGALGLALAAYGVEMLHFLLGLYLYRRAGYRTRALFLAHFDGSVIRESFRFGVLDMSGSLIYAAASAIEIFLTQTKLVNYAEVWGNWMMANNFLLAFDVIRNLVDCVMPGISEAISNTRAKLSQYYVAMTYKWGGMIAAFLAAVLFAVADRFIIGSTGPEFSRAAIYVFPLIFYGSVIHLNILGDAVALASNHPGLKTAMIAGEQAIRLALTVILLPRFQINALIIAYIVATLARGLAVFFINSRVCFKLRYYAWQSLAAPLLACAAHAALLRAITGVIWQGDQVTSIVIFLIGILFSYPIYAFLYGLAGGWDDGTLDEFRRAAELLPFLRPMARLFVASTSLGARLSPLHNRFPITIRGEALAEAELLTAEKVNLTELAREAEARPTLGAAPA
jgi:O-antigen/teichoic acid export membrane protein